MVLDSSAILALTKKESGANKVKRLFEDAKIELYVHSANLCEVFHQVWKARGESEAHAVLQELKVAGIIERNDMNGEFWRDAGALIDARRIAGKSLPLGNALGVALSRRLDAEFVIADKHEILPLHDANLVTALFIR